MLRASVCYLNLSEWIVIKTRGLIYRLILHQDQVKQPCQLNDIGSKNLNFI